MPALKLTQIGNALGVILPQELLTKLGVAKGDTLYAIETGDGIRLSAAPDFETQMAIARRIMHDRRNVLRALAEGPPGPAAPHDDCTAKHPAS